MSPRKYGLEYAVPTPPSPCERCSGDVRQEKYREKLRIHVVDTRKVSAGISRSYILLLVSSPIYLAHLDALNLNKRFSWLCDCYLSTPYKISVLFDWHDFIFDLISNQWFRLFVVTGWEILWHL